MNWYKKNQRTVVYEWVNILISQVYEWVFFSMTRYRIE